MMVEVAKDAFFLVVGCMIGISMMTLFGFAILYAIDSVRCRNADSEE